MGTGDPRGSVWRRWDPHIHAPGTALNDQFPSDDSLDDYLTRIESSSPPIEGLGVTDYLGTDCYERVLEEARRNGRLRGVGIIFPNVEMRLAIGTTKGHGINLHLLVSPEADDHLDHLHRFLSRLTYEAHGDTYRCTPTDLERLGRGHDPKVQTYSAAKAAGVNQFKVDFNQLRMEYMKDRWMQANSLVAVAASSTDGTGGMSSGDGAFDSLRQEIERFSHLIFSSTPSVIAYWQGRNPRFDASHIIETYGALRPCIHGSDAHAPESVGQPDLDRFTWIKGDPVFESLRQTCMEPGSRVFVGAVPPELEHPDTTLARVSTVGLPWLLDGGIELNPGLIAIIGARGSGKTAVADLIAHGAGSSTPIDGKDSFVTRARPFLGNGALVSLEWSDGAEAHQLLEGRPSGESEVHYLSQQFVDRLCSADEAGDELIEEIQKVVFESHAPESRLESTTFEELVAQRLGQSESERVHLRERLDRLSADAQRERQLADEAPGLATLLEQTRVRLAEDRKTRSGIVQTGGPERAAYYQRLVDAQTARERAIQAVERRRQALGHLAAEIARHEAQVFPSIASDLRVSFAETQLRTEDWQQFAVKFSGKPGEVVADASQAAQHDLDMLRSPAPEVAPSPELSEEELGRVSLHALKSEIAAVAEQIGVDRREAQRLSALDRSIKKAELESKKYSERLEYAKDAPARRSRLLADRAQEYERYFELVIREQNVLQELYRPLETRLSEAESSVGRLRLVVVRRVDTAAWAEAGEGLLDLRTSGRFRGRGSLLEVARSQLEGVWETGSAQEVSAAMRQFRIDFDGAFVDQAKPEEGDDGLSRWSLDIGRWLYSTEHISVSYSFEYEEVPLSQLSPGTRGIVLLLLYLALDLEDRRPLIIDQPEENLDPKSVFRELVDLFRHARSRRQVIIVTHNANLVVNTDVDQVIVAASQRTGEGAPPTFEYVSGGLESDAIREHVCDILEGGEKAFRERARRLRVRDY